MGKAVFLDRDGTINEDIGDLCEVEKLVFTPRALEALRILNPEFQLFIITNQPGIARGVFTEEEFLKFTGDYSDILRRNAITINETFYCPHERNQKCPCIKPSTYFIDLAKSRYPVDAASSFVIGDHPHDMEMGRRAGMKTVYLLSGHGRQHSEELLFKPDIISENLFQAALSITGKAPGTKD